MKAINITRLAKVLQAEVIGRVTRLEKEILDLKICRSFEVLALGSSEPLLQFVLPETANTTFASILVYAPASESKSDLKQCCFFMISALHHILIENVVMRELRVKIPDTLIHANPSSDCLRVLQSLREELICHLTLTAGLHYDLPQLLLKLEAMERKRIETQSIDTFADSVSDITVDDIRRWPILLQNQFNPEIISAYGCLVNLRFGSLKVTDTQNITVIYSIIANDNSALCQHPRIFRITFYTAQADLSLAAYLAQLYDECKLYCSGKNCGASMLHHSRRYVHNGKMVTVSNPTNDNERIDGIATWTFCHICARAGKRSTVSSLLGQISFGKFLELLLYDEGFAAEDCGHHPLSQADRFFQINSLTIRFECSTVPIYTPFFPPAIMKPVTGALTKLKQSEFAKLSVKMDDFYAAILQKLSSFVPEIWVPHHKLGECRDAIAEYQEKGARDALAAAELLRKQMDTTRHDDVLAFSLVRKHLVENMNIWREIFKVISLNYIQMGGTKASEGGKRLQPGSSSSKATAIADSVTNGTNGRRNVRFADDLPILPFSITSLNTEDPPLWTPQLNLDLPTSPTSNSSIKIESNDKFISNGDHRRASNGVMQTSLPPRIHRRYSLAAIRATTTATATTEKTNNVQVKGEHEAPTIAPRSPGAHMKDGSSFSQKLQVNLQVNVPALESTCNENTEQLRSAVSEPYSLLDIGSPAISSINIVGDGITPPLSGNSNIPALALIGSEHQFPLLEQQTLLEKQRLTPHQRPNLASLFEGVSSKHDSPALSTSSGVVNNSLSILEGNNRSSLVSRAIGSLWNPSIIHINQFSALPDFFHPQEHIITSADGFRIHEGEPATIIAYFLTHGGSSASSSSMNGNAVDVVRSLHGEEGGFEYGDESHTDHTITIDDCQISCRIYYARHFAAHRHDCEYEEAYTQSLHSSLHWDTSGGKSGSKFSKTTDNQLILKELSRPEMNSFLTFAPHYFEYISDAFVTARPTLLCKILGVYRILRTDLVSGKSTRVDLLVMENLFAHRETTKIFDLKGLLRKRHVHSTGRQDQVLQDENFIECE